ncbi:MAG: hypothetical protein BroJett026_35340 [Betaproteobacteria bacterium]|nr:MAG: hypothetical protein BroJett026_35340 [Betaproteobacteria bacterium]
MRLSAPSPQRVSRLKSLDDIRGELVRVYREARAGKLDMAEAKALAYLLSVLSSLAKDTILEDRLAALERKLDAAGGTN